MMSAVMTENNEFDIYYIKSRAPVQKISGIYSDVKAGGII